MYEYTMRIIFATQNKGKLREAADILGEGVELLTPQDCEIVRKGTQLYVEGRIRTRSWSDRDNNTRYTTEILADSIQLLGRRSDNPATKDTPGAQARPTTQPQPVPPAPQPTGPEDDDLPF